MLANLLSSPTASRRVRERSLFVLAQMGSEEAGLAIAEVARGNRSPELQRKAIQYLGVFGGPGNRKILSDLYGSTTDNTLLKQILNSFDNAILYTDHVLAEVMRALELRDLSLRWEYRDEKGFIGDAAADGSGVYVTKSAGDVLRFK